MLYNERYKSRREPQWAKCFLTDISKAKKTLASHKSKKKTYEKPGAAAKAPHFCHADSSEKPYMS